MIYKRRVVGSVFKNISPSNIFLSMLPSQKLYQNCQAAFGHSEGLTIVCYAQNFEK